MSTGLFTKVLRKTHEEGIQHALQVFYDHCGWPQSQNKKNVLEISSFVCFEQWTRCSISSTKRVVPDLQEHVHKIDKTRAAFACQIIACKTCNFAWLSDLCFWRVPLQLPLQLGEGGVQGPRVGVGGSHT